MAFAIKRSDGKYVTPAGSFSSHTKSVFNARVYPTRESAEADCCPENEYVVELMER